MLDDQTADLEVGQHLLHIDAALGGAARRGDERADQETKMQPLQRANRAWDTKQLKSYAPEARRDFIAVVTDRAALYGLKAKEIAPVTKNSSCPRSPA